MKKAPCTCPLCVKGDYNPVDYMVDLSELERERLCGVSGLMRVKDEARWVAQSIDSCIAALDELIICYQESTDGTEEIVEQKRLQYPDKIRTFFYAPPVYTHNLSKEDFQYAGGLPEDSVHLLSNYYNYTLLKARYRYAVKIDADQIYFSDRLKRLCDAYRNELQQKITLGEYMADKYLEIFRIILGMSFNMFFLRLIDFLPFQKTVFRQYNAYLFKQVCRIKCMTILSGINLSKKNGKWGIAGFKENIGTSLAFNGSGDTFIFQISDHTFFSPMYQTYDPKEVTYKIVYNDYYKKYRIIERFHHNNCLSLYGGFCWYHMKFADCEESEGHLIDQKVELVDFFKIKGNILDIRKYHFKYHLFSFVYDKNIPPVNQIIK